MLLRYTDHLFHTRSDTLSVCHTLLVPRYGPRRRRVSSMLASLLLRKHVYAICNDFHGCKNGKLHLSKKLIMVIVFLFLLKTYTVGTRSNRLRLWGGSNVYPRSMFSATFHTKIIISIDLKIYSILNRRVILKLVSKCAI